MDKLIVLGMGISYPYPTHDHPYLLGYVLYSTDTPIWDFATPDLIHTLPRPNFYKITKYA